MPKAPKPLSRGDIHDIAMALPEVELGTSWGDRPTYLVRGRGFLLYRGRQKDAVDPDTGEPMDDVIRITVPSVEEKRALLESEDLPFFTTDHFRAEDRSVLLRERDLDRLDDIELAEIITDAWASVAPASLVKKHLG